MHASAMMNGGCPGPMVRWTIFTLFGAAAVIQSPERLFASRAPNLIAAWPSRDQKTRDLQVPRCVDVNGSLGRHQERARSSRREHAIAEESVPAVDEDRTVDRVRRLQRLAPSVG